GSSSCTTSAPNAQAPTSSSTCTPWKTRMKRSSGPGKGGWKRRWPSCTTTASRGSSPTDGGNTYGTCPRRAQERGEWFAGTAAGGRFLPRTPLNLSTQGRRPRQRPDLAELPRQFLPGHAAVGRAVDLAADAAGVDERRVGRVGREVPDGAVGPPRHPR